MGDTVDSESSAWWCNCESHLDRTTGLKKAKSRVSTYTPPKIDYGTLLHKKFSLFVRFVHMNVGVDKVHVLNVFQVFSRSLFHQSVLGTLCAGRSISSPVIVHGQCLDL